MNTNLALDLLSDSRGGGGMPLAPPPMPPQGLMAHLQGGDGPGSGGGGGGPTWVSNKLIFNKSSFLSSFFDLCSHLFCNMRKEMFIYTSYFLK